MSATYFTPKGVTLTLTNLIYRLISLNLFKDRLLFRISSLFRKKNSYFFRISSYLFRISVYLFRISVYLFRKNNLLFRKDN